MKLTYRLKIDGLRAIAVGAKKVKL